MYSPRNSYGSPPAELSNNPFIDHPANALARYPDIDGTDSPAGTQYTSWLQQPSGSIAGPNPSGYPEQGASPGYGGRYHQPQVQPQETSWNGNGGYMQSQQGYSGSPVQNPQMTGRQGFQPSSSFGQQLASQVNNAYGVPPQPQPQQAQYTGYPMSTSSQYSQGYQPGYTPQQQQQNPQYLTEFDPYAQSAGAPGSGGSQYRPPHPREYVQQHKVELESWDGYAWKQVQNSFDALKEAWAARKRDIEARVRSYGGVGLFGGGGYGTMYGGQAQEVARLENLVREAELNFDSVAASTFQMHEVYTGYRQSGDLASKKREGLKAHEGGGQQYTNPFDIFQNFFGGGFHGQQQVRRGPNSISEIEISLTDIYTGANIDLGITKRILCDHCRGSGAASSADIHTCPACNGAGVQIVRQQIMPGMFSQAQVTCGQCGGRGSTIVRRCPHCGGAKVLDHTQHYTLEVPKGAPEGYEVVFDGEGDESPDWEPGDIITRLRTRKDKGGWRRKESSLYWRETIGIEEALLGFERNLTHLDGHIVELKRHGVTQPGFVQTIKSEGMPVFEHDDAYGELYIEYNVVLPREVSPDMRRRLLQAFHAEGDRSKDEL
ncbi:uncharacterized protein FIBRA_02117 [Fibroporia radiculosa]|uniref:CR-type domain-containing protein n=1 Tax=Fibroporia radiculosa TaxID=599839 RepID=J4GMF9_9APHY|nr:uncharacterized protein FIBRA_02117 [Fibroporia radiculosa]CCM00090.1 predicted protein [Fibroporia radiculosa]